MPLQRRKPKQQKPKTLGGEKLRALRNAAGQSLLDLAETIQVDLGEHVDAGHLNKIETGSIKKPLSETLAAILAGLQASYQNRRDVLEAFGYKVPMSLPTEQEIDEVVRLCAYELADATHPVLVVDLGQRLCAWNRYTPRMISLHPDAETRHFLSATLLDVTFNPAFGVSGLITNPDEFLPPVIHYIKASLYPFRQETWCTALIAQTRTFPGFSEIWDSLPDEAYERFVSRRIVPLNVQTAGFGVLQFRMSTVEFDYDRRFQIIHFTPYGATTLRACAEWAEEEGVL